MPRPLRFFQPDTLYFVTNRTVQSRLLMTPSPYVNNLIGGVLARALGRFQVKLYAFVFLSNHFHLIASATKGVLSDFIGYVESNIAREVGCHIDWHGPFWQRRYSAEPILDDEALVGRLRYIFAHGVKEGLVNRAIEWPGLTCIPELAHGQTRCFPWYDRTAQYYAGLRGEPDKEARFMTYYPLTLAPLPFLSDFPETERHAAIQRIIAEAEHSALSEREGRPALGAHAVVEQDPQSMPARSRRRPRPLCHASTRQGYAAFKEIYRAFVATYREASRRFRSGDVCARFPDHAYRPPLPFVWRALAPPLPAFG